MPGLAQQRIDNQFSNGDGSSLCSLSCPNGSVSGNGFWSKHRDDVSYNKLQKFWSELSPQARQQLLRIDKPFFFEQARKNLYCSRCHGLLMEGFNQIQMHGKASQEEGTGGQIPCIKQGSTKYQNGDLGMASVCQVEVQDPSVHPWGGLTATKDGILTLLSCYLCSASLKGLQNVFDSARARERERELLYPDACGGGGRGWISQGMVGYGRGHGTRETCALHNARLSVDTLVDFWSALGEETRQSLLRMKEEDFIERLMYRFDSKRFCRDCRRNVIREFKELKELKRMRREPRCTSWFCVADSAFQYEVSHDTIQADWHQTFIDNVGKYRYFEWAVGTGEGKCDILEFENVGMSGRVQVNGLDLGGLSACYITLRACKMDGRCSEYSVKAHALKGQQCVHCRLVVGDGFVTITRGESIRRFFEHAEEAEEEEDDDSVDKDGNDLDGECSRPQKHAKSPELAREFLLDAATVIFKEQVEKAFREGTARQNAHSIFVCLALKLLEERVHVACKEITTLEKQMKLLEEEEKEKREEEERKERRRTKEKEKKLRRKERLRIKEKDRENRSSESDQSNMVLDDLKEESPTVDEQLNASENVNMICESPLSSQSQDILDEQPLNEAVIDNMQNHSDDCPDGEVFNVKDDNKDSFASDHLKVSYRQLNTAKEWSDRRRFAVVSDNRGLVTKAEPRHHGDISSKTTNGFNKQLRSNPAKSSPRNCGAKFGERFHCVNNRAGDRYDFSACSCNQHSDYRAKVETNGTVPRVVRETKSHHSEPQLDSPKPYYRVNKYNQMDYQRENCGRSKTKITTGNSPQYVKKVWEPMESQRKVARSNSDTDVTLQPSAYKVKNEKPDSSICSGEVVKSDETSHKEETNGMNQTHQNFHVDAKAHDCSKEADSEDIEIRPVATTPSKETTDQPMSIASSSDNCSSCLSEGDNNTCSSNSPNAESLSSSDSDDASQQLERRETSLSSKSNFPGCQEAEKERTRVAEEGEAFQSRTSPKHSPDTSQGVFSTNFPVKVAQNPENGRTNINMGPQHILPPMHNPGIPYQMFQAPSAMGYYHQNPVSWPAAPASGLIPFPPPNHYLFPSPYGYGLNGTSRFMPYGELQHHALPMVNPGQVPIYQPVVRANHMHSKDQVKIPQPYGVHRTTLQGETKTVRVDSAGRHPMESLPNGDSGERNGNSEKLDKNNSGFSLFHFGGPLALSPERTVPCKEGKAGRVEDDQSCSKKDDIEEYNLFAASNGIKFSFF